MNEPVRHHYVPQFLLRRFANAKEQLRIHRIADGKSFTSVVLNTGQVKDGHTLYGSEGQKDRSLLESSMSHIETESGAVIDELVGSTATEVTDEQKQEIIWLAGLQILRSRFTLGCVAHGARDEYPKDASAEDIRTGLLRAALFSYLATWPSRNDQFSRPKDRWNPYTGSLLEFRWDVMRYRSPSLVLADAFAAQSGIRRDLKENYAPVEHRWAMHGFGVPLHDCERVTIPLSPYTGLYLHRFEGRRRLKAEDFNQYTVYSSRDFVAHNVDWSDMNPRLYKSMARQLELQRMLRMAMPASF
ncbi:DUF4238 domain-containing protein [Arthrobacter sp. NPDC056493]|uniref:DUF4238 domain-containing protein n=1 Tax=Arthrobacter sp. NPDC056493 TaxID=3345839 RepID=UPI00366AAA87